MTGSKTGKLKTLFAALSVFAAALPPVFFSVCKSPGEAPAPEEKNIEENDSRISLLVIDLPQTPVYNGKARPLAFTVKGGTPPELVYYSSAEAREEDAGGTYDAPVNAGTYYVRIKNPPVLRTRLSENISEISGGEDIFAEYRILKRPVTISAAPIQSAYYNGDPKRVQAAADPPVPLSFSYYPNRELRDAASAAAEENARKGNAPGIRTEYRGYRRVNRAPSERGAYYVWIYYPGDDNHESASANVEFTIRPPERG